ncbi:MAG TPA: hypothetical protein VHC48_24340 [Puia sp.]|nr:hypothetical protein [Puia sp.]
MKFLKYLFPLSFIVLLAGCLDIDEKVNIKKDGSGQMAMDMDMSQMVEMLQTYMGKEELARKGMDKMDTTLFMKDLVDTVKSLSPEKKAALRDGTVHIKMDLDQKVFKTHMQFPFTSYSQLQTLYRAMSDGSLGSTNLLGGLGGQDSMGGGAPDINQFNGIYDFTAKDGAMSKKLNMDKWKALTNDPQLAQMKQASQMGVEILYTTTITLPRPVKKVDNTLAKLSDDKKTVMIRYNLADVFEHPEQFGYSIEY